ncbi:hypothetical protein, partial [Pseudomonas quasicaspiana]|uniref:hypothetical protein n=1 Tax=Pseudomonas quasicaspiana TaxID=2829821 RepID=UPI001E4CE97E
MNLMFEPNPEQTPDPVGATGVALHLARNKAGRVRPETRGVYIAGKPRSYQTNYNYLIWSTFSSVGARLPAIASAQAIYSSTDRP